MKVLVVDDHPIVRAGVRRLLAAEPQITGAEAATANEALAIFRNDRPDLVILDLNLPGIGGLEIIGRLKLENASVRILILSMHDNPIYVTHALRAGAAGYVSKNAPPEQMLEAIRRVARGHTYIEHQVAQELALSSIRYPADPLKDLSRRDLEILRLLGEGHSLPQIAETLGIGYKTVANNCSQIKAKLGVARTADLVRIAIQNGIAADR
jgi:two-component system, NarL family, invasion response regulator UvrY